MRPDESPASRPLRAASASEPGEDQPPGGPGHQRQDDGFEIPFPAPPSPDRLERISERDIYGDERGGQIPKRPSQRKGDYEA